MKSVKIGGKTINFHATIGTVLSTSKNLETRISSSVDSNSVRVNSMTIVHDQLFLRDQFGKEHSFQLQDFNLACREGNSLAVIWGVKEGRTNGPYLAVINYTTGNTFFGKSGLFKTGNPNVWKLAGLFVGILILGFTILKFVFLPIALLLWFSFIGYFFIKTRRNSKKIKKAIDPADFTEMLNAKLEG